MTFTFFVQSMEIKMINQVFLRITKSDGYDKVKNLNELKEIVKVYYRKSGSSELYVSFIITKIFLKNVLPKKLNPKYVLKYLSIQSPLTEQEVEEVASMFKPGEEIYIYMCAHIHIYIYIYIQYNKQ